MKQIFETYIGLLLIILIAVTSISIMSASVDVRSADNYSTAVVAELEDSNFKNTVIDAVGKQAVASHYELYISLYREDGTVSQLKYVANTSDCVMVGSGDTSNVISATIVLKYDYSLNFLNTGVKHQIRAYAT